MRFNALLVAILVALSPAAHAQDSSRWQQVGPEKSRILLLLPHLEKATVVYSEGGWNAKGSQQLALASATMPGADFPRADIYLHVLGPGSNWSNGAQLNAGYIKSKSAFFNGRDIKYEGKPSINANRPIRYLRFASGAAHCMAFELRLVANEGATGVYCPPPGTALSDTVISQVTEGIYVRRGGKIERGIPDSKKPLPGQLSEAQR